jgi:heme-degrading monooxygenase HmoA
MSCAALPAFTTFTIFQYAPGNAWWAMRQMGLSETRLNGVPGLDFARMLGSGKGLAFSLSPDWYRYALVAVWKDRAAAQHFFTNSDFIADQKERAELWSVEMEPLQSGGLWAGVNPFGKEKATLHSEQPVAVLTRASLYWRALPGFVKQARLATRQVEQAKGLLFSCGIGELPLVRQATFSVWKNAASMKAFAYGTADHKTAIRDKKRLNWYKEELFARFAVLNSHGTCHGTNPLISDTYYSRSGLGHN